ncbi:MAG: hypothetical protein ACE5F7_06895 [Nitrospiria bacterium]
MMVFVGAVLGIVFLAGTLPSQAANLRFLQEEYRASQEELGRQIQHAAWTRFDMGRVQEKLGNHIAEEAPRTMGMVSQEVLGSVFATSGHMRWVLANAQETLGSAIVQTARLINEDGMIVRGKIQEAFGDVIQAEAQESYFASQEALGREISREAQLKFAGSVMANTLYAALRGEEVTPVSHAVTGVFRKHGAYADLANFRLGVSLLENETDRPLSHIIPEIRMASTGLTAGYASKEQGWGGFAEYGGFALFGFIFSMWAFVWTVMNAYPIASGAVEEEEYEAYQKAA